MAWYEYAAVFITCLTALSLVYSTIRTGISPMPSSIAARKALLTLSHDLNGPIYELGSGWGGLAAALSRAHPQQQVIGIELSWLPWLYSTTIHKLVGPKNLEFKRGDFLNVDLSPAAAVVCYLHPKGMDNLAKKLTADAVTDVTIISNTFRLPGHEPVASMTMTDLYQTRIYRYEINSAP
ncbi:MAG: hypothetical protein ACON3Z_19660 [Bradymonadia bacterium]